MKQSLDALVEGHVQQGRMFSTVLDRLEAIENRLPSPEQEKFSKDFFQGAEIIGTVVRWTKNTVVAFAAFVAALAVVKTFLILEWTMFWDYIRHRP